MYKDLRIKLVLHYKIITRIKFWRERLEPRAELRTSTTAQHTGNIESDVWAARNFFPTFLLGMVKDPRF